MVLNDSPKKTALSIVIPCYRSEKTIVSVVDELRDELARNLPEKSYEIILVNDCSPDKVWDVIRNMCAQDNRIKGILFSRNFGQHAAMMAGYRYCNGEIIVSMDDDGQAPIESVKALIDKIEEGYDVVFGKYRDIKQSGFRKFGSKVNILMSRTLLNQPKNIVGSSFFAMRNFIAQEMVRYENPYPYLAGLMFRTTRNATNVEVVQRSRMDGKSGYSIFKLFSLWMNGFTAFSVKPLRIASIIGVISAVVGLLWSFFTVIYKFLNPNVQIGYSSIMAVILFIGGLIMLMLGLIGEYIGRIYICLNKSPQYVIREIIDEDAKQNNKVFDPVNTKL